ncbi:hypothetical protein NCTGTJJY_CDS0140 [Serratia phage 92A1]|nr:hypothetical protein NCTGTJJY_CDS0140 [Serratia phage 92A1]
MKIIKTIKSFFKGKVATAIASSISAEDKYNQAALTLIHEIDRLSHSQVASVNQISKLRTTAQTHAEAQSKKEREIKHIAKTSGEISKTHAKIAMQHKILAEAATKKALSLEEKNNEIDIQVVNLGSALDEIKAQLEYIRLAKESNSLGLELPSDVIESVGHVKVDVDTLIREVDTFLGSKAGTMTTTDLDLEMYMADLAKQA